mmetsp:Transcript_39268/g.104088  ORF Transcript_39268/g.104088 Transcript_39268/m.104088 type:complete len:236 (-) Transcript_39268:103-810(-)
MSRADFGQFVRSLNVTLRDPALDTEILYDMMDREKTDSITCQSFLALFEPSIERAQKAETTLQFEDIVKDTFETLLDEPHAQRYRVNEAFLVSSQRMEQEHKGFGVNFWGSRWRFRLYDDIFGCPKGADGRPLPFSARYANIKTRLANLARGKDPWLTTVATADPAIAREIAHVEGIRLFCGQWLAMLQSEEVRDEERMRSDAAAAEARARRKAAAAAAQAAESDKRHAPADVKG